MIIVVTASNNIYALNATTGTVIWQRTDSDPQSRTAFRAEASIPLASDFYPVVDLVFAAAFLQCA